MRRSVRRCVAVAIATWAVVGVCGGASARVAGFSDVRGHEYYAAAAAWLRGEALTTGFGSSGEYRPDGASTRAQTVTFLWRLAGEPDGFSPHGFTDVPDGAYYEQALRWAAATDLTTGVGGGSRFAPDAVVTRAEAATFLWRYDGEHPAAPSGFVDVSPGSFYSDAVGWLRAEELTTGVGGSGRFEPDATLTRGQLATFVWRYRGSPAPPNPGDAVNCGDFASYGDAAAWFGLYHPHHGDVAHLDNDGDGRPCVSLPGGP